MGYDHQHVSGSDGSCQLCGDVHTDTTGFEAMNNRCQRHIDEKFAMSQQLATANRKLEVALKKLEDIQNSPSGHMYDKDSLLVTQAEYARAAITTITEMKA
jgi:hypothetical protein